MTKHHNNDGRLPDEASFCAAEAEALGGLDAATQRRMVAGFRDFTDRFK